MWRTKEVLIGKVGVGGKNPIRIQSMTTTATHEVEKTATQILQLEQAGCEIVRLTVQGKKEALATEKIKEYLVKRGCFIPLVADIHFYPPAALFVVDFVEKVRINPGNFLDKRATFQKKVYEEKTYQRELEKIEQGFSPLVEKCKKGKKALRIGVNHGSLSDRIMNRLGDTPEGMVESALEYARVCRKYHFHDFLFSMKSSNPKVMIEAYLLLVEKMKELSWNYPLHLGVTEAGFGQEGRIKSSVGIGSLLCEGIGDTIRVSLTEEPVKEIDPARKIIEAASNYRKTLSKKIPFFQEKKEKKKEVGVWKYLFEKELKDPSFFTSVGFEEGKGKIKSTHRSLKGIILQEPFRELFLQNRLVLLQKAGVSLFSEKKKPFFFTEETSYKVLLQERPKEIFISFVEERIHRTRELYQFLKKEQIRASLLLHFVYKEPLLQALYRASMEVGSILLGNMIDGILLSFEEASRDYDLSFSILQACGLKRIKAEYVSCPGCGRTLFDLEEVSQRIREKTSHLVEIKIAIMGCIVNGPGEMADADFGYVGSKAGKIDLYVGKTCVERFIDFSEAEERLISLIKKEGKWKDPPLFQKKSPI